MSRNPSSLPIILDEHTHDLQQAHLLAQVALAVASIGSFVSIKSLSNVVSCVAGRALGAKTVKREQTDMHKYIGRMGERNFCRKY
jgi:hypothetical protein